jgi:hypothetical protein
VERLCSDSGNTIANRRTRLDADKVNNLLFIKRNMRVLKEIYPPSVESSKKRKNSLISADSTPSTTTNKRLKLTTESQKEDGDTVDKENVDEQL